MLQDREGAAALARTLDPLIRSVDGMVGEKVAMLVEIEYAGGLATHWVDGSGWGGGSILAHGADGRVVRRGRGVGVGPGRVRLPATFCMCQACCPAQLPTCCECACAPSPVPLACPAADGPIAAGLYVHPRLSQAVGTCTAAFARCMLAGQTQVRVRGWLLPL